MQMAALRKGVLRIQSSGGSRYLELSLRQRLYLLWVFRNFRELPENVMSRREQQLVATVCGNSRFLDPVEVDDDAVIGTVERATLELVSKKMPATEREMEPLLAARRHG